MLRYYVSKVLQNAKLFEFSTVLVDDNPDIEKIERNKITIVGGHDYAKWAYLRCPCGCNEVIMLSLNKKSRPNWSIKVDLFGRPTLNPSINKLTGCHSHFWIKKGNVLWAKMVK
jgi:hypothetical protein